MKDKLTIAVVFGGQSSEHDISCMSVQNVIADLDQTKYDLVLVGITKDGRWLLTDDVAAIADGTWENSKKQVILSPDTSDHGLICLQDGQVSKIRIDCVFPVLHGKYGEDGTIQGLCELARIPFVGCGVLASAVCMDKATTKVIVQELGIRQADYVVITQGDLKDVSACIERVEKKLSYPVFVKPSAAGSSQGVSKATDRDALVKGLAEAVKHDNKVLVEETIVGREIECAVLGGHMAKASGVGEVLSADHEMYSYEAKYFNAQSHTDVHPKFPDGKEDEVRKDALQIFKAVGGYGLARVDFFLEKGTNEVVFNEINTMPGFTGISMYPMLWKEQGVNGSMLVNALVALAFERYNE